MNNKNIVILLAGASILILLAIVAGCTQQTGVKPKHKQAKAKKCIDCHPEFVEKFTKNILHAPVKKMECQSCHQSHGIIGGLFNRYRQPQLCLQCHENLTISETRKSTHKPLETDNCTLCHDPHESDYDFLLKTGPGNESCFSCHDRGPFERKHVHAPVVEGCNTCHDPHSTDNVSLLKVDIDSQCIFCHKVTEETFQLAHSGYPVEKGCILCHTPHSSEDDKLLKVNVHVPLKKGECNTCHIVEGSVLSLRANQDELCLTCHEVDNEGKKSIHQPFVQKQCTACHSAHASDVKHILSASPEKICLTCHAIETGKKDLHKENQETGELTGSHEMKTPEEGKAAEEEIILTRSIHQPVRQGLCLDCHNGHNSSEDSLLKKTETKLCYDCHAPAEFSVSGGSHPTGSEGLCNACHLPHSSPNTVLLVDSEAKLCLSCHKKTASERGMFAMHTPFARGSCGSCHKMHKPVGKKLLKQQNANSELCVSCHTENSSSDAPRVQHAPVIQGKCTDCHSHHAADYSLVMKQKPGRLCTGCHEGINKEVNNALAPHKPVVDGECTTCHDAHGSNRDNILKEGQPVLCLKCHSEITKYWREGVAHAPAVSDCVQCHNPHGSDIKGILRDKVGKLCGNCHDVTTEVIMKAHNGIEPKTVSCVSCHDSHGSQEKGLLYPVAHTPFAEGKCSPCHPGRSE